MLRVSVPIFFLVTARFCQLNNEMGPEELVDIPMRATDNTYRRFRYAALLPGIRRQLREIEGVTTLSTYFKTVLLFINLF